MPLATAGEELSGVPLRAAVHKGLQVVGVPEQLVTPLASKANILESLDSS